MYAVSPTSTSAHLQKSFSAFRYHSELATLTIEVQPRLSITREHQVYVENFLVDVSFSSLGVRGELLGGCEF